MRKGEPILEIETDKVTVEIEAPASGVLREVTAQAGDVVPVGQTIALIFGGGRGRRAPGAAAGGARGHRPRRPRRAAARRRARRGRRAKVSPLARKVAEQHGVDLAQVDRDRRADREGRRARLRRAPAAPAAGNGPAPRLAPASPKARRLAAERGVDVRRRSAAPGRAARSWPPTSPPRPAVAAPRPQRAPRPPQRRPARRASAPSGASWPSA